MPAPGAGGVQTSLHINRHPVSLRSR